MKLPIKITQTQQERSRLAKLQILVFLKWTPGCSVLSNVCSESYSPLSLRYSVRCWTLHPSYFKPEKITLSTSWSSLFQILFHQVLWCSGRRVASLGDDPRSNCSPSTLLCWKVKSLRACFAKAFPMWPLNLLCPLCSSLLTLCSRGQEPQQSVPLLPAPVPTI